MYLGGRGVCPIPHRQTWGPYSDEDPPGCRLLLEAYPLEADPLEADPRLPPPSNAETPPDADPLAM